jgi:hypothetical protein
MPWIAASHKKERAAFVSMIVQHCPSTSAMIADFDSTRRRFEVRQLAIFAVIRRASSRVSNLAPDPHV